MNTWSKYFKLGCVAYASYPETEGLSLLNAVEKIVLDPIFEVIEMTRVNDAAIRQSIMKILNISEITFIYSGGPIYLSEQIELGSIDASKRKYSLEQAKRLVDEAIELGATMHLVASGPDPGPDLRASTFKFLCESLSELCSYASANSDLPLILNLEPFDREVEHRALLGPTQEAVQLANEVRKNGSQNFGLTLDLSHLRQLGENPSNAAKMAADVVNHIHLASCYLGDKTHSSYGDKHVRFGFPGADVKEEMITDFLRALLENGVFNSRDTPVSLEVKPQHNEDPDLVLVAVKRSFIRAWNGLF